MLIHSLLVLPLLILLHLTAALPHQRPPANQPSRAPTEDQLFDIANDLNRPAPTEDQLFDIANNLNRPAPPRGRTLTQTDRTDVRQQQAQNQQVYWRGVVQRLRRERENLQPAVDRGENAYMIEREDGLIYWISSVDRPTLVAGEEVVNDPEEIYRLAEIPA